MTVQQAQSKVKKLLTLANDPAATPAEAAAAQAKAVELLTQILEVRS